MTQISESPTLQTDFDHWLTAQIEKLSVDTLKDEAITCTACGEVTGEYIIEYKGNKFRYPADKTYAFLMFVAQGEGTL
jgi:hypothetical protein